MGLPGMVRESEELRGLPQFVYLLIQLTTVHLLSARQEATRLLDCQDFWSPVARRSRVHSVERQTKMTVQGEDKKEKTEVWSQKWVVGMGVRNGPYSQKELLLTFY